jgi:hypothetical protein
MMLLCFCMKASKEALDWRNEIKCLVSATKLLRPPITALDAVGNSLWVLSVLTTRTTPSEVQQKVCAVQNDVDCETRCGQY